MHCITATMQATTYKFKTVYDPGMSYDFQGLCLFPMRILCTFLRLQFVCILELSFNPWS